MATFVLCHGGWTGGWQWRTIPSLLRAKDHTVFTPTLTGLGERVPLAHPDVGLDTHITDVVNVILFEELHNRGSGGLQLWRPTNHGRCQKFPIMYLDAVARQAVVSGLEALDVFEQHVDKVGLVLSNVVMPEMGDRKCVSMSFAIRS